MKRISRKNLFLKFLLGILVVLLPFIFLKGYIQYSNGQEYLKKKQLAAEFILDDKRMMGSALTEDKQPFEDHIKGFFTLSLDDIVHGGFGSQELHMNEREKYFSTAGLEMYKKYVEGHKGILKSKKEKSEFSQVHAQFVYGSQVYEEDKDIHYFKVEGHFCYGGGGCTYVCEEQKFILNLSVKGDFQKPKEMEIESWNVGFGKAEDGSPH